MADVQFILPVRSYLVGVNDAREGELRLIVDVAADPKNPQGFRRAYLIQACSVADMRSGTGSIKGLVRSVEDQVLEFDRKLAGLPTAVAAPEPLAGGAASPAGASVSQGVDEAQSILAEVLEGTGAAKEV